jgi:hypothetical protein
LYKIVYLKANFYKENKQIGVFFNAKIDKASIFYDLRKTKQPTIEVGRFLVKILSTIY